jgi:filamentous hemagglutinin family protein
LGQTAGALSGPNFTIGVQNAGQQIRGNNLFHSFSDFNVQTGQTATFTGPSSIANIINRVTGQNISTIDGLISSRTAMPNANFFLINPNGMVLGPHASFNVGGSVNLSTADYLRMTDGAKFFASLAKQSTLSSAPVAAFGFLGETPPKPITVQSDAGLTQKVPFFVESDGVAAPGSTQQQPLSLIGGDIGISGRTIATNGGQLSLVSIASGGEVLPTEGPGGSPLLSQVGSRGAITLSNGATLDSGVPPRPNDPFDAAPSGNIFIRAGQFVMEAATITAQSRGWNTTAPRPAIPPGPVRGGTIDIESNSVVLNRSNIQSSLFDRGFVDPLTGTISSRYVGSLFLGGLFGCSDCPITYFTIGEIQLKTNSLVTEGSSLVASAFSTSGSPRAGDVTIQGMGGNGLEADSVALQDTLLSAQTGTSTFQGIPTGGSLTINAKHINLFSTTVIASGAQGGPISFTSSDNFSAVNSVVNNSSGELGTGGIINITAGNTINLTETRLLTRGLVGESGNIDLTAPTIHVSGGSLEANANFKPGSVRLTGDAISLSNNALLSVNSFGPVASDPAGDIVLTGHDIRLSSGSTLQSTSVNASGGNIKLLAENVIHLRDSQITTSVTSTSGNGGNIIIDPPAVVLQNSQISANALQGHGGTISITGNVVLVDPTSVLSATAGPAGVNGQISIQAPLQQLSGAIAPLPQAFAIPSNLYGQHCAAQKGGQFSSFVHGSRDGLPPQPGDLIPSPLALNSEPFIPSTGSQPTQNLATVQTGFPGPNHGNISFTTLSACRS